MSIEDKYKAYTRRQTEDANAKQAEEMVRQNLSIQETTKWFEDFLSKRFPDQTFVTEPYIYDNSGNRNVGPVKRFSINEYTYYLFPPAKGKIAGYTASRTTGKGCDRICTLVDPFEDKELFKAIDDYSKRSEFSI